MPPGGPSGGAAGPRRTIAPDAWEARLAAVRLAKEDMNRLVMNFLVTEVCVCRMHARAVGHRLRARAAGGNRATPAPPAAKARNENYRLPPLARNETNTCRATSTRRARLRPSRARRPAWSCPPSLTAWRCARRSRAATWRRRSTRSTTSTQRWARLLVWGGGVGRALGPARSASSAPLPLTPPCPAARAARRVLRTPDTNRFWRRAAACSSTCSSSGSSSSFGAGARRRRSRLRPRCSRPRARRTRRCWRSWVRRARAGWRAGRMRRRAAAASDGRPTPRAAPAAARVRARRAHRRAAGL